MAQVIWTEPAIDNINEVAEYIALSNPMAASKLVLDVLSAVGRLEDHPESGRVPEEIQEFTYREVVVNPCRVFYKYSGGVVYVLYVLRQEIDVRKYIIEAQ